MAIILRLDKGSELTFAEVDGNFSSLFYSANLVGTNLNFYTYPNVLASTVDLSTIPGFGGITVQKDGNTIINAATGLNFTGTGVTVTANGSIATVDITAGGGTDTYTNLTETPQNFPSDAQPNIPATSTFENKTFTEMMNLMLYPTLFPSLSNPSSGLTLSTTPNIAGTLREVGTVYTTAAGSTINLNSSFNRGSINPAYGTNGFRSGLPNAYNYTGPGSVPTPQSSTSTSNNTNTTVSYTIVQGNQSWQSSVSFDAGQMPLDSTGNNFDPPGALSAGTTSNSTRTLTGVYPIFATTVALNTATKQSLRVMGGAVQIGTGVGSAIKLVTESGGGGLKQFIDVPTAWPASNLDGAQQFSTLSNTFEPADDSTGGQTAAFATWTATNITKTIQGVPNVAYTRYTNNTPTPIGPRQISLINI